MVFERRLRLKAADPFFVNWDYVAVFDFQPAQRRELFGNAPKCWEFYEYSRVLYVPTPVVLADYFTFALTKGHNSFLFQVTVFEHSVSFHVLQSFHLVWW